MKTVSDIRTEKAHANGDYVAYVKDQEAIRYEQARIVYLQANPDVGTLIRDGVEIFYRNVEPYYLGEIEEFSPASVIKPSEHIKYGLWMSNPHYKDRISFPV